MGSLRVPSSVTEIGVGAFHGCTGLESVEFHEGLSKIECYAFAGCSSLGSLRVPPSVTEIGQGAFENCSKLASAELHDGLQACGWYVFLGCTSLERIRFPRLSERMEAIALYLHGKVPAELGNRMDEISRMTLADEIDWERCRESLGGVRDYLTCLERAMPLMEMALWKM